MRRRAVLKTVPRHLFLPDVEVADTYADRNVATKRDTDGAILSSASMPTIVAMMLEQVAIEPGHGVLEIGTGTGYNAALLRELVGPAGVVATVDVDPDVVDAARRNLATAGCDNVHVICGDGEHGHHPLAPYDRIIVTAGAWDLPEAWWDQLTPGGRIVVPLRWRGQTRSVAFDRQPGHLISRSVQL